MKKLNKMYDTTVTPQVPEPIVLNAATGKDIIFIGKEATLTLTLKNNSGADLKMTTGSSASVFFIKLPTFLSAAYSNIVISGTGWDFTQPSPGEFVLTFNGDISSTWAQEQVLTFTIKNVITNDPNPTQQDIVVVPQNFTGAPLYSTVKKSLVLNPLPPPPNTALDIREYIDVNLVTSNVVYTSTKGDPLANSLFLVIKNKKEKAIYRGSGSWPENPVITVSFLYGNGPGELAPDNDKKNPELGSAWDITTEVIFDETQSWSKLNPKKTGTPNTPVWTLKPGTSFLEILGVGEKAQVEFQFSNIISLTSAGLTMMKVQFANFYFDENTPYTNYVYPITINKQDKPNRRIARFFATPSNLIVKKCNAPIKTNFNWAVYGADSISLVAQGQNQVPPFLQSYGDSINMEYGQAEVDLTMFQEKIRISFTLNALNKEGTIVNSTSFPVSIQPDFFVDTRDNKCYPTLTVNGTTWLAKNFEYNTGAGSFYDPKDESAGIYYTWEAAQKAAPSQDGWRLPSIDDWKALINTLGPYSNLIIGGTSGFNANLGGWKTPVCGKSGGGFVGSSLAAGEYVFGYFWTGTADGAQNAMNVGFIEKVANNPENTISTDSSKSIEGAMNCRYVRDDDS